MGELHKDIKTAISSGRLEGLDESILEGSDDTQAFAKVIKSYTDAFEKEGFSEIKALKAVLLIVYFDNWKKD